MITQQHRALPLPPRRVKWSGHHDCGRGWFHGWIVERWGGYEKDTLMAVIESEGGTMLTQPYFVLEFIDKMPEPTP